MFFKISSVPLPLSYSVSIAKKLLACSNFQTSHLFCGGPKLFTPPTLAIVLKGKVTLFELSSHPTNGTYTHDSAVVVGFWNKPLSSQQAQDCLHASGLSAMVRQSTVGKGAILELKDTALTRIEASKITLDNFCFREISDGPFQALDPPLRDLLLQALRVTKIQFGDTLFTAPPSI